MQHKAAWRGELSGAARCGPPPNGEEWATPWIFI